MNRLFNVFKEINNFLFLLRTVRNAKKTKQWQSQRYPLRINWIGTIYTVINLPPEVYNGESAYERNYIIEETKATNRYFDSLNLSEIINLNVRKINRKNTEAYLITYKPLFNYLTFWWMARWGFAIWLILWLQKTFDLISYGVSFYEWAHDLIISWTS